jgi:hypothetical protein
VLSTGNTFLDEFDLDSEYSSYLSHDGFDESSQVSAGPSTSSLSLNVDIDASPTGEVLPQNPVTIVSTTPVETDQSGWMEEGKQKKPQKIVSVKEFKRGWLKFIVLVFVIILNLQGTVKILCLVMCSIAHHQSPFTQ